MTRVRYSALSSPAPAPGSAGDASALLRDQRAARRARSAERSPGRRQGPGSGRPTIWVTDRSRWIGSDVVRQVDEAGLRLVRFLWCGNDGTIRAKASGRHGLEGRLERGIGVTVAHAGDERARPAPAGRGHGAGRRVSGWCPTSTRSACCRTRPSTGAVLTDHAGSTASRRRSASARSSSACRPRLARARAGAAGGVRERVLARAQRSTAATCRSTRACASRRSP